MLKTIFDDARNNSNTELFWEARLYNRNYVLLALDPFPMPDTLAYT